MFYIFTFQFSVFTFTFPRSHRTITAQLPQNNRTIPFTSVKDCYQFSSIQNAVL